MTQRHINQDNMYEDETMLKIIFILFVLFFFQILVPIVTENEVTEKPDPVYVLGLSKQQGLRTVLFRNCFVCMVLYILQLSPVCGGASLKS